MDATNRFSNRVDNYIRFRPSYPVAVVAHLERACGLLRRAQIADVGSGTGLLAELFLRRGHDVVGVEPNREMREAGERLLAHHERFTSVPGTAEATTLEDATVDLVTAGQAYHWFEPEAARREFQRILRPRGFVAVIWNDRRVDSTPFLRAYEAFLHEHGTDYAEVQHRTSKERSFDLFFGPDGYTLDTFENAQEFDLEGLEGRVLSSSYIPDERHPRHAAMRAALRELFASHAESERVVFEYETQVFWGRLSE